MIEDKTWIPGYVQEAPFLGERGLVWVLFLLLFKGIWNKLFTADLLTELGKFEDYQNGD